MDVQGNDVLWQDRACRRCGFNLRGLPRTGDCPECGLSIAVSLREPYLQHAEPNWVRGLASGVGWILWSVFVGLAGGIIVGPLSGGDPTVKAGVSLIASLVYLIGVWRLTSPEPGVHREDDPRSRGVTRWSAGIAFATELLSLGVATAHPAAVLAASTVSGLASVVAYFGLFIYAARLALRLPDGELARVTRVVMWGIVVSFSLTIGFGVVMAFANAAGACMCVGGAAFVFFALWSIVLLFKYRGRFLHAAEAAGSLWEDAETPGSRIEPYNH